MLRKKHDFLGRVCQSLEASFSDRVNGKDHAEVVSTYRERLGRTICQALWPHEHNLLRSPEGLGKTSALMDVFAYDPLDDALSRFPCFAFRSIEQAERKAAEYRASGEDRDGVMLRSFWTHYEASCQTVGAEPLKKDDFFDHSLSGILRHIQSQQPAVFDVLEQQGLWKGNDGKNLFGSAMTVLFTSHDLARTWHRSQITRLWYDPNFEPFSEQKHDALRIAFSHIVFDEPEIDKILHRLPDSLLDWLKRVKRLNRNWKKKSRKERVAVYESEKAAKQIPGNYSFEECDEWLRLSLSKLQPVEVDYAAIPFGYDAPGRGMYSGRNGKRFYFGVQSWINDCNCPITFLTTEFLVSRVLVRAYEKLPIKLNVLDLHANCDLFPINVPLLLDKRAAADRRGQAKITALAQEKLSENPNAIVIGNGIEFSDARVKTFQRVKGLNGFEQNDLIIIPTFLAADEYALLNVTGQWLNLPEAITCFYEDQISQAVGRNQGFRKTDHGTVTMISSPRLYRGTLKHCFRHPSARIRLTEKVLKLVIRPSQPCHPLVTVQLIEGGSCGAG